MFSVGETLTLVGQRRGPGDGTLPNSSLIWRVEKHHDTHFHPFLQETAGNNIPISAPSPKSCRPPPTATWRSSSPPPTRTGSRTPSRATSIRTRSRSPSTPSPPASPSRLPAPRSRPNDGHLLAGLGPDRERAGPARRAGPLVGVRWLVGPRCANAHDPDAGHRRPTPPSTSSSLSQTGRSDAAPATARARISDLQLAQHAARGAAELAVLHAGRARVAASHDVQRPPRRTARARMDVLPGNISTPADEPTCASRRWRATC